MRRSIIGRIAAVLGIATAMSSTGLSKREVVEAYHDQEHRTSRGVMYANGKTVQYYNRNGQCPRKHRENKMAMDGYLKLRRKVVTGHLDSSTPFPNFSVHDNSDNAKIKRRMDRAIAVKERHERRRNGIQYLTV